ncbi:MAG: PqqD family protein [Planctomycetota bacterium]|nr:PqqD family protein [Planctomycetota bacterium]
MEGLMAEGKRMAVYRRAPGTACRPIDDAMILVHAKDPVMVTLNRTGGYIWSELDGVADAESLAGRLRCRGVDASAADVDGFLRGLVGRGFCERFDSPASRPDDPLPLPVESPAPGELPGVLVAESIEAMMGICNSTTWRDGSGCMTMPGWCSVLQS